MTYMYGFALYIRGWRFVYYKGGCILLDCSIDLVRYPSSRFPLQAVLVISFLKPQEFRFRRPLSIWRPAVLADRMMD
jgi:hypothetical protein